jgi:hypothetical protein
MNKEQEKRAELRAEIFKEPITKKIKKDLISYIVSLYEEVKKLPVSSLTESKGHSFAMDIAGALAYQGADGVDGDDWITEQDEPALFELTQVAGKLDNDPSDESEWSRLFEIIERLH